MYVIGTKELRGLWQANGKPFYDNTPIWTDRTLLIDYESWFLQKKVSGDLNMIRTTAIARNFFDDVINYVKNRKFFENKSIKLLTYHYSPNELLSLQQIL